jgi:hypothetical protein
LTAAQICTEVGEVRFAAYWRFSIVRIPFDRLASQYAWMPRRPDLCDFIGFALDGDFTAYLRAIGRRTHVQWMAQVAFLTGDDRALLLDTLYRCETFAQDAAVIFARLGLAWFSCASCAARESRRSGAISGLLWSGGAALCGQDVC